MNRSILAGVALCGLLLVVGLGAPPRTTSAQADTASQLLQVVNQVRADHGLAPFRYNVALAAAAQNQANHNATTATYGHSGAGGTQPQDRANAAGYIGFVVENVVGGWDLTPRQAVTWWINSPVHYNTLVTTRYAEAGTGFAVSGKQRHYTLVVGRPSDAPVAASAARTQSGPPAFVAPITLSEPREDGSIVHTVRRGHTLWAIAARYGVTLDTLRLYNNLQENAFLRPGDELIIQLADGQEPPPTPTPPLTHRVREGETLWTIAARYRLKLEDILWYNNLTEEAILRPGDELVVRLAPGESPPPTPTPRVTHLVQPGDSLWSIAALHDLTVGALLALNSLNPDTIIQPGDELKVRLIETPTATPGATGEPVDITGGSALPGTADAIAEMAPEMVEPPTTPALTVVMLTPDPSAPTTAGSENSRSLQRTVSTGAYVLGIVLTAIAGAVFIAARRIE